MSPRWRIGIGAPLLRFYLVYGLIGLAGPHLIVNFVAPPLPAGLISLIMPLIPMLTYACAILFRRRSGYCVAVCVTHNTLVVCTCT